VRFGVLFEEIWKFEFYVKDIQLTNFVTLELKQKVKTEWQIKNKKIKTSGVLPTS
jgi:hypothetical protein